MVSNGPGTKGLASHFYDASGKSFRVPEGLSADEHEAAKRDAYARAVDAWNALDKGKRHRIVDAMRMPGCPTPTTTCVATSAAPATPLLAPAAIDRRARDEEWACFGFDSSDELLGNA